MFRAAYSARLPVLLKGPTGCGKTRFVEHMTWRLYRETANPLEVPLITVSLPRGPHRDRHGRALPAEGRRDGVDGWPLTRAVRSGAICYLDEIVEARKDTTVLIHSLTDHRRILPIDKTGELVSAHPEFLLVISYNPGYQSVLKDLKPSTRQRFVSLEFDYPSVAAETAIIAHEARVDADVAERLATIGERVRNFKQHGFEEGVSTRLLIYAGQLMAGGIDARRAAQVASSPRSPTTQRCRKRSPTSSTSSSPSI